MLPYFGLLYFIILESNVIKPHLVSDMMYDVVLFCRQMDIYDAAERYMHEKTPVIILAGKDYGSGSSRDWAAKGPFLQVNYTLQVYSSSGY